MKRLEQAKQGAADLHWLAFLLTGRREIAVDVALERIAPVDEPNPFFSKWMLAWSRRVVIAKALTAVREELARSARRIKSNGKEMPALPPRSWTLGPDTDGSDLVRALLSIELFPRAAVLLLVFEGVPLKDTAILLDADPDLVREAQMAGLRELTINLARIQGWTSTTKSNAMTSELQYA